jgi:hypothetical protein
VCKNVVENEERNVDTEEGAQRYRLSVITSRGISNVQGCRVLQFLQKITEFSLACGRGFRSQFRWKESNHRLG